MLKNYSDCYGVKLFLIFYLLLNLSNSRFPLTFFLIEVKKASVSVFFLKFLSTMIFCLILELEN